MIIPSIYDLPLAGKRVLVRFDGDVPVRDGQIDDDYRLKGVLPTLRHCLSRGASLVLMAHRGRPDGRPDPAFSNRILADYFSKALGEPVVFVRSLTPVQSRPRIVLLENLRFHSGEESNSAAFAEQLARWGDVYCNDAFGVSHRSHASVVGVPRHLPHGAGERLLAEVSQLECLLESPQSPYCAILGGAKAGDKSPIIADLIGRVNSLVVGGLIAVTYLAAMGTPTGRHETDGAQIKLAQSIIRRAHEDGVELAVPVDYVNQAGEAKAVAQFAPADTMLDIGPRTRANFARLIGRANTIFWNGAMGKFEEPAFAKGTLAIAHGVAIAEADVRITSGGDTVAAIHDFGLETGFTFISTGGGATLEYIAGHNLPGIAALTT